MFIVELLENVSVTKAKNDWHDVKRYGIIGNLFKSKLYLFQGDNILKLQVVCIKI